jgi:hypothetical protein
MMFVKKILFIFMLIIFQVVPSDVIWAGEYKYSVYDAQSTSGDGTWGSIFQMEVFINSDLTIRARISKKDGTQFVSDGDMYLQRDHYGESSEYNIGKKYIGYGSTKIDIYSWKPLNEIVANWSGDILKIYARYETYGGGYAWCGPVKIRRYIEKGSVCVNISPYDARNAGAKWRALVNGWIWTNWYDSGQNISGFDVGLLSIQFKPVDNWQTPDDVVVNINYNQLSYYNAYYQPEPLSIPSNFGASENYYDKIAITWNSVQNANQYEIYRSPQSSQSSSTKIASTYSSYYYDYEVSEGNTYYYWIRAKNNYGSSSFNGPILGKTLFHVSVSPTSQAIEASGGDLSFFVGIPSNCRWKIISADSGIAISQSSGYGSQKINFSVAVNEQINQKELNIRIQFTYNNSSVYQNFTIIQKSCNYYIYPDLFTIASSENEDRFRVSTQTGCYWSVNTNSHWIKIFKTEQDYVYFKVEDNLLSHDRSGEIIVTGKNSAKEKCYITQKGSFLAPPEKLSFDYEKYECSKASNSYICRDNIFSFMGQGVSGAIAHLYINQIKGADVPVNDDRSFLFQNVLLPSEGRFEISATQSLNDYTTTFSDPLIIDIDMIIPEPVTHLKLDYADDSGKYTNDCITNQTRNLTISGTGENQLLVNLYDNGEELSLSEACFISNNVFSIDVSLRNDGIHLITARQLDNAGNISDESIPLTIIVDTIAPQIKSIEPSNNDIVSPLYHIKGKAEDFNPIAEVRLQVASGKYFLTYVPDSSSLQFDNNPAWIPVTISEHLAYSINTSNVNWEENISYTITHKIIDIAGNKSEIISKVTVGNKKSRTKFKEFSLLSDQLSVGDILRLTGTLYTDIQNEESPISRVPIGACLAFSGTTDKTENKIELTSVYGNFKFRFDECELDSSGQWIVKASFLEDSNYQAADSEEIAFTVTKHQPELTILSNGTSFMPEQQINITGQLNHHLPDTCHAIDLKDLSVKININAMEYTTTCDQTGQYTYTFNAPENESILKIQALFPGNRLFFPYKSDFITIKVKASLGKALIIQSYAKDKSEETSFMHLSQFIDFCFNERGIDNTIHMGSNVLDGLNQFEPSVENVETIMRNSKDTSILYVVLFGHAGNDAFYLDFPEKNEIISSGDLSDLLDRNHIQSSIIIMGSCYSASFIEGLEKENRTIIVSAGKNEESQHGLRFGSNVYMGDFFLASFFRAVLKNETLKDCFNHASNMTQKWTSAQTPVFFGADFGIGISPRHKYSQIIDLPDFITIEPNVNSWDLLAGVDEMTVDRMWIDIKKPDGSKQMTRVMCEEEKYVGKRLFKAQDTFMDSGIYDIYFVVEDKLSKEDFSFISSVKHMTLLKIPETANQPPENFKLLYPKEKEKISTTDWFVWENAKDPENEQVFYTLYISEDQDFNEPSLRIKGLKVPYYKLTAEQALNDRTEYYWKIQAMDISGGINESNTLSFTTNNENCDLPVWVQLNFHDIIRNESVDSSHCPMTQVLYPRITS